MRNSLPPTGRLGHDLVYELKCIGLIRRLHDACFKLALVVLCILSGCDSSSSSREHSEAKKRLANDSERMTSQDARQAIQQKMELVQRQIEARRQAELAEQQAAKKVEEDAWLEKVRKIEDIMLAEYGDRVTIEKAHSAKRENIIGANSDVSEPLLERKLSHPWYQLSNAHTEKDVFQEKKYVVEFKHIEGHLWSGKKLLTIRTITKEGEVITQSGNLDHFTSGGKIQFMLKALRYMFRSPAEREIDTRPHEIFITVKDKFGIYKVSNSVFVQGSHSPTFAQRWSDDLVRKMKIDEIKKKFSNPIPKGFEELTDESKLPVGTLVKFKENNVWYDGVLTKPLADEKHVKLKRDKPVESEVLIARSTIVAKLDPKVQPAHGELSGLPQKTWVHQLFETPLPVGAIPVEPTQDLPKGTKCLLSLDGEWTEVTIETEMSDGRYLVSYQDNGEKHSNPVLKSVLIIEKTEIRNINKTDPLSGDSRQLIDKTLSGYQLTLSRTGRLRLPLVRLLYEELHYPIPDAKKLVFECPSVIATGLKEGEAKELMAKIKKLGGKVKIEFIK